MARRLQLALALALILAVLVSVDALPRLPATATTPDLLPRVNILLTGFTPFGDFKVNPSQLVALALNETCSVVMVPEYASPFQICFSSLVLDVAVTGSTLVSSFLGQFNASTADSIAFDIVLHLGLENAAAGLKLETIALNHLASAAPNSTQPIISDGPQLLPSTIDLTHIRVPELYTAVQARLGLESLAKASLVSPTRYTAYDAETWSRDAGTFYCNETLYRTLYAIRSRNLRRGARKSLLSATFVHLPSMETMELDVMQSLVAEYAAQLALPLVM